MLLTLDLPEQVLAHLENKASAFDIPVNLFTSRLLESVLRSPQDVAWRTEFAGAETSPGLLALVAEIAALPKESALFEPATKTVDELFLDDTDATLDEEPVSPKEWDRLWAEFEQEMKKVGFA
jgi:hypothetical protein